MTVLTMGSYQGFVKNIEKLYRKYKQTYPVDYIFLKIIEMKEINQNTILNTKKLCNFYQEDNLCSQ